MRLRRVKICVHTQESYRIKARVAQVVYFHFISLRTSSSVGVRRKPEGAMGDKEVEGLTRQDMQKLQSQSA